MTQTTMIRPMNVEPPDRYAVLPGKSHGAPSTVEPPKERCPACNQRHLRQGYCQGADPLYTKPNAPGDGAKPTSDRRRRRQ